MTIDLVISSYNNIQKKNHSHNLGINLYPSIHMVTIIV